MTEAFNPLVSIVIPVYNGSNYLREAIDSALAQTYKNIEVLVINDGSNDGGKTRDIALSYGDRIRYFEKENGGVATALNLGIREMRGEYFSWLSHDDVYDKKRIIEDIKVLRENKGKITFSRIAIIDHQGFYQKEFDVGIKKVESPYDVMRLNGINMCSMTVQRACLKKVGLFNEKNRTIQDVEMSLLLAKYYPFFYNANAITYCRDHPNRGSYSLKKEHYNDSKYMCDFIKNNFSINEFFSVSDDVNDNQQLGKLYVQLGNIYNIFHGYDHADECYRSAFKLKHRKMSKLYILYLLGSKRMHSFPYRQLFEAVEKTYYFMKTIKNKEITLSRFQKRIIKGKNNVVLYQGAFLKKTTLNITGNNNTIIIGKGSRLDNVKINISGDEHSLVIGYDCIITSGDINFEDNKCKISIGDGTIIYHDFHIAALDSGNVLIGDCCLFSSFVDLRTSDSHSIIDLRTNKRINKGEDVHVGNRVWLGTGVVVLKGGVIGNDSIVGFRSIVTNKIPSNVVAVGMPAKVTRKNVKWITERI